MNEKTASKYYHVNKVGSVDGPVGMDIGIWLNFETDQGKIRLKLSHEDAAELSSKLDQEPSIAAREGED